MEREKRKGLVEEEMKNGKKRKRKDEKEEEEEPTDEEVDEFFRILKRMHVAMEYFGGVKSKLLTSQRWSSEAMADGQQGLKEEEEKDQGEREKLLEEICEKEKKKKKKIKSGHGMLDLNADPSREG